MVVVAEQRQVWMWVATTSPVSTECQISRSWTWRSVIIASVAPIAAARVCQVVVQRGELVVVVVHVSVAVGSNCGAATAQNVVDHETGARRLQDRHGAALGGHRHL